MDNFKLVSTSHISKESVQEIKDAFEEFEPDIVAVELDYRRLQALQSGQRPRYPPSLIFKIGVLGYLFALIGGKVQQKLGGVVGMMPGSEMLTAVREAGKRGKQIYLVDQNVEITLRMLSNRVPFREKIGLAWELISAPFRKGERMNIDLNKVPAEEVIEKMKGMMKEKMPVMYKVLVEDRNKVMVRNIKNIRKNNPEAKILAVMGAGHSKEVLELLEPQDKK